MSTLDVWLDDVRIATLTDLRGGFMELTFTEEALEQYGEGSRAFSLALPVRPEPYSGWDTMPFVEGLLPEGQIRERLARACRVSPGDSFALLRKLGRDCAGALVVTPPEEGPAGSGSVEWLGEVEVQAAIERLADEPLGVDPQGRVRLSLAGVQDKLVVCVRSEDGAIGRPIGGRPSTHILKPPSAQRDRAGGLRFPGLVENEGFCMSLAAASGLDVARAEVRPVGADRVLLVERYDREVRGDGVIRRLHQEDSCQALGIDPFHKYEEHGGPSLARIASLLSEYASTPIPDTYRLLDLALFNVLIGNCDAHGKNVSLLHGRPGGVSLAPAYDLVSTTVYPAARTDLAMGIGGTGDVDEVDEAALVAAHGECGIPARVARRRIALLLDRVQDGLAPTVERAKGGGWQTDVTDAIAARVTARAAALRASS